MNTPSPRTARSDRSAVRYVRGVMVAIALLLPTLSLAILGTLWLWQNDYLIIWAASATLAAVTIYGLERWLVSLSSREARKRSLSDNTTDTSDDLASTSETERSAFASVEAIADQVDPDKLTSREALLELGTQTVAAVARQYYPGQKDPLWKFTVPEALTLVGHVSEQLNRFIVSNVPLGDQLTVAQLMTIYRWRSMVTIAEKAYDIWRVLRFVNPATAVAGELREKLSGELIKGARTEFTRRLAQAYVREVGRAAIELYSGRLRPDTAYPVSQSSSDEEAPQRAPIRLLVLGQGGVGKSSVINALTGELRAAVSPVPLKHGYVSHQLEHADAQSVTIIDSPQLDDDAKAASLLRDEAERADLIVWVLAATRADRSLDARLLADLRVALSENVHRRSPPILFVLTNIDRLRPFKEWSPPYDVAEPSSEKAQSIRQALEAVASDLRLTPDEIIPVMTATIEDAYNIDALWAALLEKLPQAINTQLARALEERSRAGIRWGLVWRQARNAGRVIGASMWGSSKPKD